MKPKRSRVGRTDRSAGYDRCQTPPSAVTPLLPYLDSALTTWEPAAGEGYLAGALPGRVIRSDILTGQNFFSGEPDEPWDRIVTNPPYSVKFEWLARCYELGKPFALLVPLETIGAKACQRLTQRFGFEMLLLDRRVNFGMPNKGFIGSSAQFPTFWLCWHLLPQQLMYGEVRDPAQARLFEVEP